MGSSPTCGTTQAMKKIETTINIIAGICIGACPPLTYQVLSLNKHNKNLQLANADMHKNIRKTLTETTVVFSKNGELTTSKIPVGSSLHIVTSDDKLLKVEIEEDKLDPELDPKYASLFKK